MDWRWACLFVYLILTSRPGTTWATDLCESTSGCVRAFGLRAKSGVVEPLGRQADVHFRSGPAAPDSAQFRVHPNRLKQVMNGFGGALTESCAINLMRLPSKLRRRALRDLFSKTDGAGFDYVRLPLGASDFADGAKGSYTYDDTPGNKPDPNFRHFNMDRDEKSFALLRRARWINPNLKVMISPWSAPAWMKIPQTLNGGSLNPKHYGDFARYFVKIIRELYRRGVPVDTLTVQNEPAYPNDLYPSMGMSADEQTAFIRDFLAPELRHAGLTTGIFLLDHNWDLYPDVIQMLNDPALKRSVSGVAYHCYGGDPSMMEISNITHPDVPVFQTECSDVVGSGAEDGLKFWLGSYSLTAGNFGSTGSLAWNLCLDQKSGPTNGGCLSCRGMLTTDFSSTKPRLRYEPEYHAFAQISRHIRPGSRRIEVTALNSQGLEATAFLNWDNQIVFIAWNPTDRIAPVHVRKSDTEGFEYALEPNNAVTFTWRDIRSPSLTPSPRVAIFR